MDNRAVICLFFLVFTLTALGGCASRSSDNPHDDFIIVGSKKQEKETGNYVLEKLESNNALYQSDTLTRYVTNIGNRLAVYSDRTNLEYHFNILKSFKINAFAAPGGYIFVTRGLLSEMQSEAELAGVLAHEIGHTAARHHAKRKQLRYASLLASIAMASQGGARAAQGGLMAGQMVELGYSRQQERQADRLGLEYAARAGYDPRGLIKFLKTLQDVQGEIPVEELEFIRTHPYLNERIGTSRVNVQRYLDLVNDTPLVNRYRYNRARRNWLKTPGEKAVLANLDGMIDAYEQQDTAGMKAFFHEEFKMDRGDSNVSTDQFLSDIAQQFQDADTIQYSRRLIDLDVGDTDATITYEFQTKQWDRGSSTPSYTDGFQRMVWRKDKDSPWRLMRLR